MEAHSDQHVVIECPVLRKCRVCGEHKPQTDFYKLAPTNRAKKDILGIARQGIEQYSEALGQLS